MDYYQKKENVDRYIKIAKGFDGKHLIDILSKQLPAGSSLLELGMGPGKDLDLLRKNYTVCGSDNSTLFLDLYKAKHPDIDLLLLDAVSLETDRRFDCIYSNKVLHHLSVQELKQSVERQTDLLNAQGLICHSFWRGDGIEEYDGMHVTLYQELQLKKIFEPAFQVLEIHIYKEMEQDDSILIIAAKL